MGRDAAAAEANTRTAGTRGCNASACQQPGGTGINPGSGLGDSGDVKVAGSRADRQEGFGGGSAPSIPRAGGEQPRVRGAPPPLSLRTELSLESAEGFLFRHSGDTRSQNLSLAFNSFSFFILQ